MHWYLFRNGSINNDDVVYRVQAETLARGELFLDGRDPVQAYQPWFSVPGEHGYIAKYVPVVAGLLAVSVFLVDSSVLSLAALAAAVPLLTYALSRSLSGSRAASVTAAALLASSPLLVVQSGLELSYLPAAVFLMGFLAALYAGLRHDRLSLLVLAGAALSLLAATRPYDALLLAAAPLGWGLLALRPRPWRVRMRAIGAVAVGGLPLAALVLAYNWVATGSPLRLPFALLEPMDRLGYGERKLYPEDLVWQFGPREGLTGVGRHLLGIPAWTSAGVLLLLLGAVATWRWWRAGHRFSARASLAGSALFLVIGYTAFWGPWLSAVLWGGTRWIGPFYVLPVMVPLTILAAPTLLRALARRPRLTGLTLAVTGALSVSQAVSALSANAQFAGQTRAAAAVVADLPADALVLTATDAPYLGHPVALMRNEPGLPSPRYATAIGPDDWQTVARAGADRPVFALSLPRAYYSQASEPPVALTRLARVEGAALDLTIDTRQPPEPGTPREHFLVVEHGGAMIRCAVTRGQAERSTTVQVRVGADGSLTGCPTSAAPAGWYADGSAHRRCPQTDCISVALLITDPGGGLAAGPRIDPVLAHRRLPVQPAAGGLQVLADGAVLVRRGADDLIVSAAPAGSTLRASRSTSNLSSAED